MKRLAEVGFWVAAILICLFVGMIGERMRLALWQWLGWIK
jgi:hypothetical protein